MQIDIFLEFASPPGPRDLASVFEDNIAIARAADAAGFGAVWIAEHHFLGDYSNASAPDMLLSAIARETERIGLGFAIVPLPITVDEALRINGDAEIRTDPELLAQFEVRGKLPATVLVIKAHEIYLHCAKAIMRSGLWNTESQIERSAMPTIGQMIADQIGGDRPGETHEEVKKQYEEVLY